jgi:hypothetical protein
VRKLGWGDSPGDQKAPGNGGAGGGQVLRPVQQAPSQGGAGRGHLVEHRQGKENGSFRHPELDLGSRAGLQAAEQRLVVFHPVAGVEVVSQIGNHGNSLLLQR